MSSGIFINGRRPASKKQLRDLVKAGTIDGIRIEDTSMFPGGFDGPIGDAPLGQRIDFVGPDPYSKRNFYGSITRTATGIKVT